MGRYLRLGWLETLDKYNTNACVRQSVFVRNVLKVDLIVMLGCFTSLACVKLVGSNQGL